MKIQIAFTCLLMMLSTIVKAQDKIDASFSGKCKSIEMTITNSEPVLSLKLPNTIRARDLSSEIVQSNGDTITLSFYHEQGGTIDISQGSNISIIEKGVLAYEIINAGEQKNYHFKLPRGYRNTKKYNVLILVFDGKRTFIIKRDYNP